MTDTCALDDCDKPANGSRKWCGMHYRRWQRHGDVHATPRWNRDPVQQFWAKVAVGGPDDCWLFHGSSIKKTGYGNFAYGRRSLGERRTVNAHVYAYRLSIGPIPTGLQIDHLCHTRDKTCNGGNGCLHRRCCNPAHMEPVTPLVNTRRGRQASKTVCQYGHPLFGENVYWQASNGRRSCRTCRYLRSHGIQPERLSA
jgi:hypothetical protein